MRKSLSLLPILGLVSCTSFDPSYVTDPEPSIHNETAYSKVNLVALLQSGGTSNRGSSTAAQAASSDPFEAAYRAFYSNANDQEERRNRVQDHLISASVTSCKAYIHEMNRFMSNTDFLTKAMSGALGSAGALVSGGASQILSGAGAAVLSLGETIDETYLKSLNLDLIIKAIEAKRNEIELDIRNTQQATISEYSVESAVTDALEYHAACSLLTGVRKADEEVSLVKVETENGLKFLADKYGADDSTERIRGWLDWDGERFGNQQNFDSLREWMEEQDIDDVSIPLFINGSSFKSLRESFVSSVVDN